MYGFASTCVFNCLKPKISIIRLKMLNICDNDKRSARAIWLRASQRAKADLNSAVDDVTH